MARTPVVPEVSLVGALSAQLRHTEPDPLCPLHVELQPAGMRKARTLGAPF